MRAIKLENVVARKSGVMSFCEIFINYDVEVAVRAQTPKTPRDVDRRRAALSSLPAWAGEREREKRKK